MRKQTKRGTAAPATSDAAPVTVEATATVKPAPARIGGYTLGNIARTAAVIVANRTHFGGVPSARDAAYLLAMHHAATAASDGVVTLAALAAACETFQPAARAAGVVSVKPHDGGVVNRVRAAGHIVCAADGFSLTLTDAGRERARLLLAKQAEADAKRAAAAA